MRRRFIISCLFLSISGCLPIKQTYYEAIDTPKVAAGSQGNAFPCPPIYGYRVPFHDTTTELIVEADPAGDHARLAIFVTVGYPHQVTFQALSVQLTSLVDPVATSSAPITFYIDCDRGEQERKCPRTPAASHTLEGPAMDAPSRAKYVGMVDVPPGLASGFMVALPYIHDGASKPEAVPIRFLRRNGVLLSGEGGCG